MPKTKTARTATLEVISAVFYDGGAYNTYFINHYESSSAMITKMLVDLLSNPQNDGKTVYIHNLSGFDGMFLLKHLVVYDRKFEFTMKDDKIISISVNYNRGSDINPILNKVIFKDSLSLLSSSLKALAVGFDVEQKGDFDHTRSDSCVTKVDFEAIRSELLEYNKLDCLVLYQILNKFSNLVFKMFQVNISDVPTSASLAMLIYRSNFMPVDACIGITDVKLYDKLHSAYLGGAVDVYQPQCNIDEKIYAYDVNSMYPAVMQQEDYPIGSPTFIEGAVDITESFGFLKVKVTCPVDLHVPLLQTKLNGRTVAGVGTWTGWYFSEELKLALSLGYKFEVLEAILYERGKVFSDYVNTLYTLRKSFDKNEVNQLKKLPYDLIELGDKALVSYDCIKNQVVEPGKSIEEAKAIIAKKLEISIDEAYKIIDESPKLTRERESLMKQANYLNISLPISAAVTAYGRMSIYKYKNYIVNTGGVLYYSDTDSVYSSIQLPENMISNKLGDMKLEYIADRAVFLAPKVYAVIVNMKDKVKTIFKIKGSQFLKDESGKKTNKLNFSLDGTSVNTEVRDLKIEDMEKLLYKESNMKVAPEKWYRSLSQSTINIHKTLYTLKVTENKRALIYIDGKFVYTKPFILNR